MIMQEWGLRSVMQEKLDKQEITGPEYELFLQVADFKEQEFDTHLVNVNNKFTRWWRQGMANEAQTRELTVQFGGFSFEFPAIQLLRVLHAETEEERRDALEILMNELGVGMDFETGRVDGQIFQHTARHFVWLQEIGEPQGIDPMALGLPEYSAPSTLRFNQFLKDRFSHPDPNIRAGTSFTLESWAGFGIKDGDDILPTNEGDVINFWRELLIGFNNLNLQRNVHLPVSFWRYHIGLELYHVKNVERDLANMIFRPGFDFVVWRCAVIDCCNAIQAFWDGIYDRCMQLATPTVQGHIGIFP